MFTDKIKIGKFLVTDSEFQRVVEWLEGQQVMGA